MSISELVSSRTISADSVEEVEDGEGPSRIPVVGSQELQRLHELDGGQQKLQYQTPKLNTGH